MGQALLKVLTFSDIFWYIVIWAVHPSHKQILLALLNPIRYSELEKKKNLGSFDPESWGTFVKITKLRNIWIFIWILMQISCILEGKIIHNCSIFALFNKILLIMFTELWLKLCKQNWGQLNTFSGSAGNWATL